MAKGQFAREVVQDPNAPPGGNAPSQQLAVQGIMSPRGAPQQDTSSIQEAMTAFGTLGATLSRKKQNADFIEGQMASMAGKTQAEIAATGNRTQMAGFVGLEVNNAVTEWATAQQQAAATEHYATDPAAYQKHLAEGAADLIAKMGGDDFAQEQLTKVLAPTMQKLGATQAAQHAQWTQNETSNAYTSSLILSGQYAAGNYDGAATAPGGPVTAATVKGGNYRAFASQVVDQMIGVESAGNPNAQNTQSSAGGLGQFIDSTWIAMIKRHRPDIAAGKSTGEILALKKGAGTAALQREMTVAYAADNAQGLAAAGLRVTPGSTYLAHFAGLGGARNVMKGSPTATVDTTLTADQIAANKSVMYRKGRLITNAELIAWADRKMGGKTGAAPQVQQAILTNPGLPPDVHRTAVVNAVLTSLASGDGSLYQSAGGLTGLAALNLSPAQIGQIQRAERGYQNEQQNAYNMDYERQRHDLLEEAATGKFTEDEMFEKLGTLNQTYGQSDAEKRRLHTQMQKVLTEQLKGDTATAAEVADSVWAQPDMQLTLMDMKNDVLDGSVTAEGAMEQIIKLGKANGASEETTQKAVAIIMGAYDRVRTQERAEVVSATKAGQEQDAIRTKAAGLLSRNILDTGSKDEVQAGVALVEEMIIEDLAAANVPQEEMSSIMSDRMAKVLVNNNVVDEKRASAMRAALLNPLGEDGKPTSRAVEAMAFFLDLKHGANAPPEYLAKMFSGSPKTLQLLLDAESHMVGDANLDGALQTAWKQATDPVTADRIAQQRKRIDSGAYQAAVKENILSNSGLTDTAWNNFTNFLNPDWASQKLDDEAKKRILTDAGIDRVIDEETRSAVALYPNAGEETITQIVTAQMAERGAIMGSSFVMAPKDKSIRSIMGLNSTEPNAANDAVIKYVTEHGAELFGEAVWKDLSPGFYEYGAAVGHFFKMNTINESLRKAGVTRPEFVVQLVGNNFVITPASEKYAFDDDILFDDFASLPEAASAVIPAAAVGAFYNATQTKSRKSLANGAIDAMRGPVLP